jgi:hypothetical protein
LVFLSVGWIVFYVNTITKNSSSVSSVPLTIYALVSAGVFEAQPVYLPARIRTVGPFLHL